MNIQKIMNVNFAGKVNKVENNNTFVQRPILPPAKPDTFERTTKAEVKPQVKDKVLDKLANMYDKMTPMRLDRKSTTIMAEDNLDSEKVIAMAKEMTQRPTDKVQLRRCAYDKANNYTMKAIHGDKGSNLKLLDKNLNVLAQESTKLEWKGKNPVSKTVLTTDFRTNTLNETKFGFDKDGYPYMESAVKIRRDKQNRLIRKETYEKSDVPGMFNVKYEFPNGKTRQLSKATVDKKTGHTLIEKDMRSTDMTRTQYRYEDDPMGNRIVDYKITSPDGKVLMKQSQSFEVLDENTFRSSRNDKSYLIQYDKKENTITVVDEQKMDGFQIPISGYVVPKNPKDRKDPAKVSASEQKIVNMLKKIPGDELLNLANTTVQIEDIKDRLESYQMPTFYEVGDKPAQYRTDKDGNTVVDNVYSFSILNVSDDPFVFLHELGHATDMTGKPAELIVNNKGEAIDCKLLDTLHEDETFKKTYAEERKNFLKEFPTNERDHIAYFIEEEAVEGQPERGREETIAETNALMNTYQSVDILGIRTQYLQQHFPRTIAYLSEKLAPTKEQA